MPARQVRHHGGNIIGQFPSLKTGQAMPYESTIERDLLFFLEYDPTVQTYAMQPLTIQGVDTAGTSRSYTPDVLATGTTGRTLFECKPAARCDDPHTRQQIALGQRWAEANQCTFELVTDTELRAGAKLANLKLLWRYARWSVNPLVIARCREVLTPHPGGLPFGELVAQLTPTVALGTAPAHLYALVFRHVLSADLAQPLTPTTLLRMASPM